MSRSPLLSLAALCACTPGLLAQGGGAWSELDFTSGPELRSHYGFATAFLDDLNGDGVPEYLVGAPLATNGVSGTSDGYAEVLDGATRDPIRVHTGTSEPGGALGSAVARLDDIDGDGVEDYAISEIQGAGSRSRVGLVHAFSGATGATLWVAEGVQPWARFGRQIVRVPDVNGDGIDDLVVNEPEWSRDIFAQWIGQIHLLSGADGSRLRSKIGKEANDDYGSYIGLIGDVDGDGMEDLGVYWSGPAYDTPGYITVYSLATMDRLTLLEGPPTQMFDPTGWGWAFCGVGDLDGDGADEFAISSQFADNGPWYRTGEVSVYRGRTGEKLWTRQTANSYSYFGRTVKCAGDLDGDGFNELLVSEPNLFPGGAVHILSSYDGRRLAMLEGQGHSDDYAFSLAAGGDLDGDGLSEILVGALEDDVFSKGNGRVEIQTWKPLASASARSVSNAQGGIVSIFAAFPASEAGANYQLMISTHGTGPTWLGNVAVPLTRDQMFGRSRRGNLGPEFVHAVGALDAAGQAQIDFIASPGHFVGEVGLTYWACVVSSDIAGARLSSAALPITIAP